MWFQMMIEPPGMSNEDWMKGLPDDVREHIGKLQSSPEFPRHLARFSAALRSLNPRDNASPAVLAEQARRLAGEDPVVRQYTDWSYRKRVPRWHYGIINDAQRNQIYQDALVRYVRPGMIVFEVGAGTGLLAMLAARAGAAHVYTCEREPLLVEVARENIARNGLADRITVIPKSSNDVQLGGDLPERADLLVAEIVDNGLLGEQVLAITADVTARLLKPAAIFLPDQIELRGTLVGGREWTVGFRAQMACGLDVSALDRLGPAMVQCPAGLEPHLADDTTALHFDLAASGEYPSERKQVTVTARENGIADGFLHWIWLRFGPGLEFSNRPPAKSCWTPQIHVFPRPIMVRPGDIVTLQVQHDRKTARIWAGDASEKL
jgi:predicted O-methyltransferase YrrM